MIAFYIFFFAQIARCTGLRANPQEKILVTKPDFEIELRAPEESAQDFHDVLKATESEQKSNFEAEVQDFNEMRQRLLAAEKNYIKRAVAKKFA